MQKVPYFEGTPPHVLLHSFEDTEIVMASKRPAMSAEETASSPKQSRTSRNVS